MKIPNLFSGLFSYVKESKTEAKKVDWPTRERTVKSTIIVIVFAVAVALFLSAFDFVFTTLLERFVL